jgi:hypothetical protein
LKYLDSDYSGKLKKLNDLILDSEQSILNYLKVMGERSDYVRHKAYLKLIKRLESILLNFLEIKKEFSEVIQEELLSENESLLYDSLKNNLANKQNKKDTIVINKAELWDNAATAIIKKDYDEFNKILATARRELTDEEFLKFVNETDSQDTTLLYLAVLKKDKKFVKKLIQLVQM